MIKKKKYDIAEVDERIDQAVATIKRMPKPKVQGYFNVWPEIVREAVESYGYGEEHIRFGPPSPQHISEMDEVTMVWLLWLEREEVHLVWLRAEGVRWKRLSLELGWSVRKLQGDRRIALMKIVHRLNNPDQKIVLPYKRLIQVG